MRSTYTGRSSQPMEFSVKNAFVRVVEPSPENQNKGEISIKFGNQDSYRMYEKDRNPYRFKQHQIFKKQVNYAQSVTASPRNKKLLDSTLNHSRMSNMRNLSPTKQIQVLFNQVSKDSPFYRAQADLTDSDEEGPFQRANFIQPYGGLQSEFSRNSSPKKYSSKRKSEYEGMTGYQSILIAKEKSPSRRTHDLNRTYDYDYQRPTLQTEENEYQRNMNKNIQSQIEIDGFRASSSFYEQKSYKMLNISPEQPAGRMTDFRMNMNIQENQYHNQYNQVQRYSMPAPQKDDGKDFGQFNIGTSINYEKQGASNVDWPSRKELVMKDQQPTFGYPSFSGPPKATNSSMMNDSRRQPERLDIDFNSLAKRKVSPIQQAIDLNDGPNLAYKVIQQPIYRNVSQKLLQNFNDSSLNDLEKKFSKKAPQPKLQYANVDFEGFYQYKLQEMARKIGRKLDIQYLVSSMQYTSQMLKERKSTLLNNYINYCAVKIQKVFRGHLARRLDLPLRAQLGQKGQNKLQAVLKGWRVRRIFRLKETRSKIKVIRDHDNLDLRDMDLNSSRMNNCERLIRFVSSMEKNGQWTLYNRENLRRPINRNTSKENKNAMIHNAQPVAHKEDIDAKIYYSPPKRPSAFRGNQSRPNQVKQQNAQRLPQFDQSTISITSNNRFEPKIHTEEYKNAAKAQYQRRMTYDPKKSASSKTGLSSVAAGPKDYMTGTFAYDQSNKFSQSAIERRSRSFRKVDSKLNQSVAEKKDDGKIFEGSSNIFTQRYQEFSPRKSVKAQEGISLSPHKDNLKRRQTYEPNLKKRAVQDLNQTDEYLDVIRRRQQVRQSLVDKNNKNKKVYEEPANEPMQGSFKQASNPYATRYSNTTFGVRSQANLTQKVSLEEDYTYKGNRNKDHGNYVKEMMIQNQEPESSGKAKDLKERLFKYNSNEKETPLNNNDTYIGDKFGSNRNFDQAQEKSSDLQQHEISTKPSHFQKPTSFQKPQILSTQVEEPPYVSKAKTSNYKNSGLDMPTGVQPKSTTQSKIMTTAETPSNAYISQNVRNSSGSANGRLSASQYSRQKSSDKVQDMSVNRQQDESNDYISQKVRKSSVSNGREKSANDSRQSSRSNYSKQKSNERQNTYLTTIKEQSTEQKSNMLIDESQYTTFKPVVKATHSNKKYSSSKYKKENKDLGEVITEDGPPLNTEQEERLAQFRNAEMQVLSSDARGLLLKSQQKTDEMIDQMVSSSRNERSSRQQTMKEKKVQKQEVLRKTYTENYEAPQLEKPEDDMSEMTEIQMFSMDGQSQDRAGNASRSSLNASKASRPSYRNPYVDNSDKLPAQSASGNRTTNTSALKTNNTSGIKSSLYASNIKYSSGIKSYEQTLGDFGNKNEPDIHKFEGQQLTTIVESETFDRRQQPSQASKGKIPLKYQK